jgi:hypothetical protein
MSFAEFVGTSEVDAIVAWRDRARQLVKPMMKREEVQSELWHRSTLCAIFPTALAKALASIQIPA